MREVEGGGRLEEEKRRERERERGGAKLLVARSPTGLPSAQVLNHNYKETRVDPLQAR